MKILNNSHKKNYTHRKKQTLGN